MVLHQMMIVHTVEIKSQFTIHSEIANLQVQLKPSSEEKLFGLTMNLEIYQ